MIGLGAVQRSALSMLSGLEDAPALQGTVAAGQATSVAPLQSDLFASGAGKVFMDLPPKLDAARTQGLFSDDPTLQSLLDNPDADLETLILAQMALNNKQLDVLNASKAKDIEANRKKSEANQAERMERLQEAKAKIESSAKKSWWSKALGVVASVAGLVGGIMAAPFTGGLSLAFAVYAMVNTVYDLANEINVAINGESARWEMKPFSIGYWVGEAAKKLGASEETAAIISASIEIVIGIAALVSGSTAALKSGMGSAAKLMQVGASGVSGMARVSSGALTIANAFTNYELAKITASLDTLQAQIDRLTQNNQQLMEMLKNIEQTRQDNNNTVSDALESFRDMGRRITMA